VIVPSPESATLAARLTPAGTAAIATVALYGPRAWKVASGLFQPLAGAGRWPPVRPKPGTFWIGRLSDAEDGRHGDDVVLALIGMVPVPRVEIHCHGGVEVVRWLLETCQARGIRVCSWQELEKATVPRPLAMAALNALVEAMTPRTAAILVDQYQGALDEALAGVCVSLGRGDAAAARRQLADVNRYGRLGQRLVSPWRVAVLGAPNVGKSSLVNALAGYQRSVVAPTPGTTRDVVTTLIAVDGWPVELADTAGLRAPAETLEGQGMERARQAADHADLCLWVLDVAAPPAWPDPTWQRVGLVINKIDLPAVWDVGNVKDAVRVSAHTGAGIGELCQRLADWLVPEPPPVGAPVPFDVALGERLQRAQFCCEAGHVDEARQVLQELLELPQLPTGTI
jgi:tRNA modification GTPase